MTSSCGGLEPNTVAPLYWIPKITMLENVYVKNRKR